MRLRHDRFCAPFGVLLAAFAIADDPVRAALLDGKTLQVLLHHQTSMAEPTLFVGPQNVVVGPAVELTGFGFHELPPLPSLVDIDFSDEQILITLVIDQPLALREDLRFVDIEGMIPGLFNNRVTVNPATNWAGFDQIRLQASGEQILVILGEVTGLGMLQGLAGQFILLDVVPEPAAAGMAAAGVGGVVALRRRRQRAHRAV